MHVAYVFTVLAALPTDMLVCIFTTFNKYMYVTHSNYECKYILNDSMALYDLLQYLLR